MAKKKEALNLHATLKEIHTMSYPGKEGYFMVGMDTMDEHSGEMVNLYLEIPFADFYSWINEDTLKKMKQQYSEKFLNINL
tara:strand:+ start:404 stop:646 length:243 start_codon:yes stop_codon:yes gene_type:complete